MKLSIITVNLNNREGLQKTIDSVICQTFKDFEWIVIDGGSTDGSKELIEQYADHFTYWVSEPDKGIYNAMNKGIKMAKGEYMQFLNSGDFLRSSTILYDVFSIMPKADIIYGNIELLGINGLSTIQEYPDVLSFSTLYNSHIPHPSSFIRTPLLKAEPYDENLRIVSDWKFFLHKAMEGCIFHHIPIAITCFDMTGISASNIEACNDERKKVIDEVVPDCIKVDMHCLADFSKSQPNAQMSKLIHYNEQHWLYHKMTTILLIFIELIDRFHGRRGVK